MSQLFAPEQRIPEDAPRGYAGLFRQGKWWKAGDGTWIRVKDMTPSHRANTAVLLLRNASVIADRIGWIEFAQMSHWISLGMGEMAAEDAEEATFRDDERRTADPEKWLRSTKLYRSLTKVRKSDRS